MRGSLCRVEPIRKGNGEKDPLAETCPVPAEQQPVKELQALQASYTERNLIVSRCSQVHPSAALM